MTLLVKKKKNQPANAGEAEDLGSIPELGRSLGAGNGNSFQYSCLENSMDRRTWWDTAHGATKSWTQLRKTSIEYSIGNYCMSLNFPVITCCLPVYKIMYL